MLTLTLNDKVNVQPLTEIELVSNLSIGDPTLVSPTVESGSRSYPQGTIQEDGVFTAQGSVVVGPFKRRPRFTLGKSGGWLLAKTRIRQGLTEDVKMNSLSLDSNNSNTTIRCTKFIQYFSRIEELCRGLILTSYEQ